MVTVVLGVASSVLMALLFHPGSDPSRIYYGTDTRLFDLMAGATVAFVAASRRQPNPSARRTLHVVGPVAAAVLGRVLGHRRHDRRPADELHVRGGLPAVRRARRPRRRRRAPRPTPAAFARALAWRPLHFIGTISYGIYLWHWPVIVYLNGPRTGLSAWPLDLLRVVVTLAAGDRQLLPGRAARPAGPAARLGQGLGGTAGRRRRPPSSSSLPPFPAVADPSRVVGTTHLASVAGRVGARARAATRASCRST